MRALWRALALLLLVSGLASAQGVPGALLPCKMDGSDCAPATGTVTTTGTLASGQVALGSGATSITGDAGLTGVGTGTGFKLGIGTDVFLGRSSAGVLRVVDGSDNYAGLRVSYAGFTAAGTGNERYWIGTGGLETRMGSGWKVAWNSAADFTTGSVDIALSRASAGLLLVEDGSGAARDVQARTGTFGVSVVTPLLSGGADSATPNATFVTGTGSRGGTDTNTAGGNLTIRPGAGTGSATGSSLIFQTPTAGASGTTAQTQTTRLTLSEPAVIAAVPVRLAGYTVATLPAGVVGDIAYVTDATAPTYLGALTGGGAVTTPVFYNGAAWVSH